MQRQEKRRIGREMRGIGSQKELGKGIEREVTKRSFCYFFITSSVRPSILNSKSFRQHRAVSIFHVNVLMAYVLMVYVIT